MKTKDEQLAEKLSDIQKQIRANSYRTLDGYRPINLFLDKQLQIDFEIIQRRIGWKNKQNIIKELDEAGIDKKLLFKKRVDVMRELVRGKKIIYNTTK